MLYFSRRASLIKIKSTSYRYNNSEGPYSFVFATLQRIDSPITTDIFVVKSHYRIYEVTSFMTS